MLELRRGDSNAIQIKVRRPRIDSTTGEQARDAVGMPLFDPVNLTGATLYFTARDRKRVAKIQLDSNPGSGLGGIVFQSPLSAGLATALVAPSVTETWVTPFYFKYDVQLIEADGTKTTVRSGDGVVREDQTRG